MPESFRLLRNNKETGPFNLDELLQQSLKPYDLVWIEGKCAGWRYPSELEILTPYLGENLTTQQAPIVQKEIVTTKEIMKRVPEVSNVELNTITETDTISEEQEITAESLEKKANEIYLRVQAYSQQKEKQGDLPATKHSRSLDDLKQEYADWLHKKKHKTIHGKKLKYIVPAMLILLIGFASFFFINRNNGSEPLPEKQDYFLSHAVEKPGNYTKQKSSKSISSTSQSFAKAPEKKQSSVDEFLDSVKRELAKQDARLKNAPSLSKYKKPVITTQPSVKTNEQSVVSSPATTDLASLIKLDGKYNQNRFKNITSLEITINNNSKEVLHKLAVDVFYYKPNKKLLDKETVYFNNIQPGGSFTLTTPGNPKARSAKFELGKIN